MADISDIRIPPTPVAPVRPPKRDGRQPAGRREPPPRRDAPANDRRRDDKGDGPVIDEYARPWRRHPAAGYCE